MERALLTPLDVGTTGADLTALVARLLAEVDQRRAEVSGLQRENLQWRQQAGYWRSRHADALQRIAALEQENEQLRGDIRQLQAEQFGRSSEKQSAGNRSQELEDPADTTPKRRRGRQPGWPALRSSVAILGGEGRASPTRGLHHVVSNEPRQRESTAAADCRGSASNP